MSEFYFRGVCAAMLGVGCALTGCSRAARPDSDTAEHVELSAAPASATPALAESAGTSQRGVAVVELFTSEGCSSCPPADQALARLAARAKTEALPVYPLSFHVDYWNYLGWRDRFSNADFSVRQHQYNWINPDGGTYTPQAVVNGRAETVGSNASRIDALVSSALATAPRAFVALEAKRGASNIDVSYRVTGDTADRVLNLALVEPRAESAVQSGENAGERLSHVNVVRGFVTRTLTPSALGTWSFAPNVELAARAVRVIAYVESASQHDVIGATALELN